MKTFLMRPITLFSLFVSGLAIFAILFSTSLFALDDVDEGALDGDDAVILGELRQDIIVPACLDNYQDLPHSQEYTSNNSWSLDFLPFEYWHRDQMSGGSVKPYFDSPNPRREQFIDLNGDGFLDYFYAFRKTNVDYSVHVLGADYREIQECVLLNNGHGWDIVYRCYGVIDFDDNTHNFYGDCALIEEE